MTKPNQGLSSFFLRNLAMVLMLIDHLAASFWPDLLFLRYIGRLAFPLFAFLIVEGYCHTKNFQKYLLRILATAIISDLPFQALVNDNWQYHPFQNVLWTFLIGLVALFAIDKLKETLPRIPWIGALIAIGFGAFCLTEWLSTDYHGLGVMTIIGFYLFRGNTLQARIGQILTLILANLFLANLEMVQYVGIDNLGLYWDYYGMELLSPQYYAILSLPILWLYNGEAGYHSKAYQTFSYVFYPLHLLVIGLTKTMF